MRRRWSMLAGGLLASLVLLAAACQLGGGKEGATPERIVVTVTTPTPPVEAVPTATPTAAPTPTPTASSTPTQICSANPDPAPPKLLQVQEPAPQAKVRVPFHVRGWGAGIGFESTGVAVAVVNTNQEVVQVLNVPPQPRDYRIPPAGLEITEFTKPFGVDILLTGLAGPTPFCLWVYLETTPERTAKGVVQVPIIVGP